eukprot:6181721-Pleurochrysis_carterae.AAC.2
MLCSSAPIQTIACPLTHAENSGKQCSDCPDDLLHCACGPPKATPVALHAGQRSSVKESHALVYCLQEACGLGRSEAFSAHVRHKRGANGLFSRTLAQIVDDQTSKQSSSLKKLVDAQTHARTDVHAEAHGQTETERTRQRQETRDGDAETEKDEHPHTEQTPTNTDTDTGTGTSTATDTHTHFCACGHDRSQRDPLKPSRPKHLRSGVPQLDCLIVARRNQKPAVWAEFGIPH